MADRGTVAIVGGGLVGGLLAVLLRRRGHDVVVYEGRSDPRRGDAAAGRSINLIVTERGIHALRRVGLWERARRITVPVLGRCVHDLAGRETFQPYGRDERECNHSVSRAGLNNLLLDAAEDAGARLVFGGRLRDYDPAEGALELEHADGARRVDGHAILFGADGAGSAVRAALVRAAGTDESIEMLAHGYKELEFPPAEDGTFRMDGRSLHIWPRGASMLMGLPNPDGSFTGTLYMPHGGDDGFAAIDDAAALRSLFERLFPDAIPHLPALAEDYFRNPVGELGTVRCFPWTDGTRTALIGDAAHAVVPFFGQGMNAGFEDCTVLDALLDAHGDDWAQVLGRYERARKPDADAIADMALDNFVEMRDRVADERFLLGKAIEHRLELARPLEYRSRYSMVVYSRIPYAVCKGAGEIQARLLARWCETVERAEDLDLERAFADVRRELSPYLARHGARLDYGSVDGGDDLELDRDRSR